jgi:hypothetical protein
MTIDYNKLKTKLAAKKQPFSMDLIPEGHAVHLGGIGRKQFEASGDPLAQHVPERATHTFALHPKNWENTFYSLTNKDNKKIKYYGPSVVPITPGTLVGDMYHANRFYRGDNDAANDYKQSLSPLTNETDLGAYKMPELLIPPETK